MSGYYIWLDVEDSNDAPVVTTEQEQVDYDYDGGIPAYEENK